MTLCVYLVGTDTAVGKTTVACALLQRARARGVPMVPFKPAQSGPADPQSDIRRLLAAANLPPTEAGAACPFSFEAPVAPGIADDPAAFLERASSDTSREPPLLRTRRALDAWIDRHTPDVVVIEGAGGLHVPMPGGTWQLAWIDALADHIVDPSHTHNAGVITAARTIPHLGTLPHRPTTDTDADTDMLTPLLRVLGHDAVRRGRTP
jgi:dethiobiotin synthetase